jgi:hypothetical protein
MMGLGPDCLGQIKLGMAEVNLLAEIIALALVHNSAMKAGVQKR